MNQKKIKNWLMFTGSVLLSLGVYRTLVRKNLNKLPEFVQTFDNFVQGK